MMSFEVNGKTFHIMDGHVSNVPQAWGGRRSFRMLEGEDLEHFKQHVLLESSKLEKVSAHALFYALTYSLLAGRLPRSRLPRARSMVA